MSTETLPAWTEPLPPCRTCGGEGVTWEDPRGDAPTGLCPHCDDGTDPDSIPAIRAALAKAAAGPWRETLDHCDCGGGYPCGHDSWVHAVHVPDVPSFVPPDGAKVDHSPSAWVTRCEHSELATMPVDTARFLANSRRYVEVLLRALDEAGVPSRAERAVRNVRDRLHSDPAVYIGDADALAAARIVVREYRRGLGRAENVIAMRGAIGYELGERHPARSLQVLAAAVNLLDEDTP